jgi:hypothetical protein
MSKTYYDCRGKEIKLGDVVVYPVRRKSEMVLKEATVFMLPSSKVVEVKPGIRALNPEGKTVYISHVDDQGRHRCVVVAHFNEKKGN